MINPRKPILTIEEILDRYYYKEWVIEELKEIGERKTGAKSDLIQRYLNSDTIHNKEVRETAQSLLSSLRNQELKQILRDHNLESGRNRNDLLEMVFTSFSFEPYIRRVRGYCNTCGKETDQELHFDNSWKATYRRCTVCNNDDPVKHYKLELVDNLGINSINDSSITDHFQSNEVSDGIKYLKTNYWQIVSIFAVFVGIGIKFYWIVGLVLSLISASAVTLVGFYLTKYRKMNQSKN